jgi:hypothetical protein
VSAAADPLADDMVALRDQVSRAAEGADLEDVQPSANVRSFLNLRAAGLGGERTSIPSS